MAVADGKVPTRIAVLDGVRGIAVLMVMFCHYPLFDVPARWQALAGRLSQLGELGVDLFFVLSGFLITGILVDARGRRGPVLRNFYIRRSLRIFPLYYGTLLVMYVVLPLVGASAPTPWRDQRWFWTYLQNIGFTFSTVPGPNHFWSLAVEEHFYLVWPIVALYAAPRTLLRYLIGAIVLTLLCRFALLHAGYGTFYFTLCRLDGLALGGLVALAARSRGGLAAAAPAARWALVGFTPALTLLSVVFTGDGNLLVQIIKSTLIGAWFAAALLLVQQQPTGSLTGQVLSLPALRSVGEYSYAMYVFHPFLFWGLIEYLRPYPLVVQYALAFAGVYFAAYTSWRLWERHFLVLKDRFTYGVDARHA